jgi:hypothetical protein
MLCMAQTVEFIFPNLRWMAAVHRNIHDYAVFARLSARPVSVSLTNGFGNDGARREGEQSRRRLGDEVEDERSGRGAGGISRCWE